MRNIILKLFDEAEKWYQDSGKEIIAFCPFHDNSRTPSFSINADNGFFHCFSCGASGNLEKFAFKLTGRKININEILDELDVFNRQLNQMLTNTAVNLSKFQSTEMSAFSWIWRAEQSNFVPALEVKESREYLCVKRKLPPAMVQIYDLRYARIGRYKGRVIIPYYKSDKCIGFNSRLIDCPPDGKRYIYEIDKDEFQGYIYGKMISSAQCILVEGPFDLLTMRSLGYHQTISTLSTTVNSHHIMNLIPCKQIIFCFDSDENQAGQRGAMKAITQLLSTFPDKEIFNVELPMGKDPNECTPEELKEAFNRIKRIRLKINEQF